MLVKMTKSSPTKLVLLYSLKKNNLTDANKFYQKQLLPVYVCITHKYSHVSVISL